MARPLLNDEELGVLADSGEQSDLDLLQPEELKSLGRILETRQNPVAAQRLHRLQDAPAGQAPTADGNAQETPGFLQQVGQQYKDLPSAILNNRLGERLLSGEIPKEIAEAMGASRFGQEVLDPESLKAQKDGERSGLFEAMHGLGIAKSIPSIAAHIVAAPFTSAAESITAPSTQIRERPEEMLLNLTAAGGLAKGVRGLIGGAEETVLRGTPKAAAAAMEKADDVAHAADEAAAAARIAGDVDEAALAAQVRARAESLKERLAIKEAPRIEAEVAAVKAGKPAMAERPPTLKPPAEPVEMTAEVSADHLRDAYYAAVEDAKTRPAMLDRVKRLEQEALEDGVDLERRSGSLGKQIDQVVGRRAGERPAPQGLVPDGQGGFVRRDPLVYFGGGAAGATVGAAIGSQIEDREGGNYAGTGAILGPVMALGGLKYALDPRFKEAADALFQIRKGRGAKGNFEELFASVLEPMLSDQPVHIGGGMALAAPVAGGVAGGLLGGSSTGTGEFSPGRAAFGAVGGAMLGALHGGSMESAMGMVNPRQAFRAWMLESKGLPVEVQAARSAMLGRQAGRMTEIMDQSRAVSKKFGQDGWNEIEEIMRGNRSPLESSPELRAAAANLRHTWDNLSLDLVDTGIVGPKAAETILTNIGTYLPRLYLKYELEDALGTVNRYAQSRGIGLSKMEGLMHRSDIPADVRNAWKEVSSEFGRANPAYLLGKRATVTAADVEFANYAKFLASSPDYTLPAGMAPEGGVVGGLHTAENGKRYMKLGDSRKLGVLKGQWVEEQIGHDLNTFTELPGALRRVMDLGTVIFKTSKIGLSPATWFRNIYGNFITADMGGLSPTNRKIWWKSIWTDYARRSDRFLEARGAGVFGKEWFGEEVAELLSQTVRSDNTLVSALHWLADSAHTPLKKMAKIHGATEQMTKMALYNYARDTMGLDVAEAAAHAKRFGFDYSEVPRWIQVTRRSPIGAPFISFSYKALPRVFENALAFGTAADPFGKFWRFWKYPLAIGAVNEYSARNLNWLDEDEKTFFPTVKRLANEAIVGATGRGQSFGRFGKLKSVLPDYIGSQQLLVPHTDQFNRPGVLDLTWTLPWGDVGESGTGMLGKQLAKAGIPFPRVLEPTNPWVQGPLALVNNADPFTGREIVQRNATSAEAYAQYGNYLMRLWGPSWVPGGFAFDKMSRAISGDYQSDPLQPTIAQALRSEVLGIKIRNVDPATAFKSKAERFQREIADDKRQLGMLRRSGASPERMNEINDRIKRKIKRFKDSLGTIADYPETDPALEALQRKRKK